ncbi:hypothetical protein BGZ89_004307 [Linnemannia elongata]|nr:hypothetical protein BGZ89_004307 [Linnemannia elongata]
MEPYQQFRLGTRIEALAVRRDVKRDYFYNRLSDIQHYFPTAWGFKVNSINILFLEDEHEQCFEPKRIAHYPNTIIDIVPANNNQEELQQQPSTPASLADEAELQLSVELDNNKQEDIGPSSQHDVDQSVPTLSVQPNTAVTTRPRRATFGASSPPAPLPDSLVTRSSPISTDALLDHQLHQQQQQQPYHTTTLGHENNAPYFSTASTEELYSSQDNAPNFDKVRQQQLADTQSSLSSEHSHDVDDDEQQGHYMKDCPQEQQQTMVELVMAQRKLDAAFLLNEELYEYPIPRLFVLLPPSFTNKNPSGEPLQNFRLYFLCECVDQCENHGNISSNHSSNNSSTADFGGPSNQPTTKPATEPPRTNSRTMVHLVKHSGYEVSRTAEFIEKYGSYVLGMLAVLKHSMALTAMTTPDLGVFHERTDPSFKTTENMVRNTIATINTTIDSLEKALGLSSDLDATTDKTDLDAFGACKTFKNLRTLDGADHRRLDTFLRSRNHDGFLGELYRITMESGRIKWVCFEHYRMLHSVSSMTSFIEAVEANGGAYSPYLSKAVINITSTAAAKDFFGKLTSPALALDELDIALDWKFGSSDLAALASAVAQSNLRVLRLDMRDDKGKKSAFEGMSLGKGRYHPLVQMVSSKRLRGVFFSNVHHLGSRVSGLPQNHTTCTLQRFHLLNVIEPADQVRLANILTSCPSLVDLRLGSFSSQRKMHPTLYHAIASLSQLKNLHIYSMDTGSPDGNVSGDTTKWEDVSLSTEALKGLVSTGYEMNRAQLEGLIQASSGIMEVLVLEFTEKRLKVVELSPAHYQNLASVSQRQSLTALSHATRPFSKLTHLHLGTGITAASIELLASVVWNLSLVHFGADEHSKRLLKYVNFASLKSLSLTDLTEDDMQPLFETFLDENRPCQLDRMDLKMTGQIQIVPDLLHKISLKRLELIEIPNEGMSKIMPILNLSRLEVLSAQFRDEAGYDRVNGYYNYIESALAARVKQLGDNFLLQCEKLSPVPSNTLSARLEGSEHRLKTQHIVFVKRAELDKQHWHSILSTVF